MWWRDDYTLVYGGFRDFAFDRVYHFVISPTIRSAAGERLLTQPVQASTSLDMSRSNSFGSYAHAQMLGITGTRTIQMAYRPTIEQSTNYQFDLFALTWPQFLARHGLYEKAYFYKYMALPPSMSIVQYRRFPTADLPLVGQWPWSDLVSQVMEDNGAATSITLPTDIEAGFYLVSLREHDQIVDQLLIGLTDHLLMAVWDSQAVHTWVTDMHGRPLPNIPVRVYDAAGVVLVSGTADAQGRAILPVPSARQPQFVVSQVGEAVSVVGFHWSWRQSPRPQFYNPIFEPDEKIQPPPLAADYAVALYTERPSYAPSQPIYYKAILRHDADGVLSNVGTGLSLTVQLHAPDGRLLASQAHTTNTFGTVHGSFALPNDAPFGDYTLELVPNPAPNRLSTTYTHLFKVEPSIPADFQVVVQTDKSVYIVGEPIQIEMKGVTDEGQLLPKRP
ncbi:MAG: hypothetical protein IPL28_22835 [Chloroflexi bacterium]|nr:hypothetical protein [Chloroflexota bacterium]